MFPLIDFVGLIFHGNLYFGILRISHIINLFTDMTTIKVKFRKSSIEGKAGVVYYQLHHDRQTKQITTKIALFPEQWDDKNERIIANTPDDRNKQVQIECEVALLHRITERMESAAKSYTLGQVVDSFHRLSCASATFLHYFEEQIVRLQKTDKLGTARNYRRTYNSFTTFLKERRIGFRELDEPLIMEYNGWLLHRKIVRNTVSFYMRILRAVYNKAVNQNIVMQSFPFRSVYTGVDRTRKRAIDEQKIYQIQQLDLSQDASLRLARDLFLFSYCTRGMAFVDMAFLRKQDIRKGTISYIRRKTMQRLSIRIEPCIEQILARYSRIGHTDYIFPIISTVEPAAAYRQYETALRHYNRELKRISKLIDSETSLSSYCARHSWATSARNHNIPLSIISAGMGHTSEKTTQIYLASIGDNSIDQANFFILERFNAIAK